MIVSVLYILMRLFYNRLLSKQKRAMKSKIIDYLLLLASSFVSELIFIVLFIVMFGDRVMGIAWGICVGLIVSHFSLSFFFKKQGILKSIVRTIIYSVVLFIFFYLIANYLYFPYNKVLYIISMIIAWEISSFSINFSNTHSV